MLTQIFKSVELLVLVLCIKTKGAGYLCQTLNLEQNWV